MSAQVAAEVFEELGRGDEVAVAERLKLAATEMSVLLADLPGDDGTLTAERVRDLLNTTAVFGEAFLNVAFPVVEYGREAALEALPRALREVIRATAAASEEQRAKAIAAVPSVGRIAWALTAFALHCDRPQALVELARARITVPFSNEVLPVIAFTDLRYPRALGARGSLSSDSWRSSRVCDEGGGVPAPPLASPSAAFRSCRVKQDHQRRISLTAEGEPVPFDPAKAAGEGGVPEVLGVEDMSRQSLRRAAMGLLTALDRALAERRHVAPSCP